MLYINMNNEITVWTHTGLPTTNSSLGQNPFYVRYQVLGDNNVYNGLVGWFANGGINQIGIQVHNQPYSLLNYNNTVNDYYYGFHGNSINQVGGLINGKPALLLGSPALAVIQNLANLLTFQKGENIVQANNPQSVYSTGSGLTTLNSVPAISFNLNGAPTNIWAQFNPHGAYTTAVQQNSIGSIININAIMQATQGSDTSLIYPTTIENQMFFNGLTVDLYNNPDSITQFTNSSLILPIGDPSNPQSGQINNEQDVWMLSMKTLSIIRPLGVFFVHNNPYYIIPVSNGNFLTNMQTRVAIVKPSNIFGDGALAHNNNPPQIFIPAAVNEIPEYVGIQPINLMDSSYSLSNSNNGLFNPNNIASIQNFVAHSPIVENMSPTNQSLVLSLFNFGMGLLQKLPFFKKDN